MHAAVLELLDLYDEHRDDPPTDGRPFPPAGRFVVTALGVARTPDVPLPDRPACAAPDARRGRAGRGRLTLADADLSCPAAGSAVRRARAVGVDAAGP